MGVTLSRLVTTWRRVGENESEQHRVMLLVCRCLCRRSLARRYLGAYRTILICQADYYEYALQYFVQQFWNLE